MLSKKIFMTGMRLFLINQGLFYKYAWHKLNRPKFSNLTGIKCINFGEVKLPIDFEYLGDTYYTRQMYHKCYQLAVIYNMGKYLRAGDTFVDIGANVGYFTAFGASLVGSKGITYSFEPIEQCYDVLVQLKQMNPGYTINAMKEAVGNRNGLGEIIYTPPPHSGGSSMVSGFLDAVECHKEGPFEVPLKRLDYYNFPRLDLVKIDVEGYEFPVLQGMEGIFKAGLRPIIICEICPSAYPAVGHTRQDLMDFMSSWGYRSYNLFNPRIREDFRSWKSGDDVIFRVK